MLSARSCLLWSSSRHGSNQQSSAYRELSLENIVSAATLGGGRTGRSGQDRQHGSSVDSIIHFRPMKQLQRGGLLSTRSPDWLTRLGASVRAWLQHWLRPKHLKGTVTKSLLYRPATGCMQLIEPVLTHP